MNKAILNSIFCLSLFLTQQAIASEVHDLVRNYDTAGFINYFRERDHADTYRTINEQENTATPLSIAVDQALQLTQDGLQELVIDEQGNLRRTSMIYAILELGAEYTDILATLGNASENSLNLGQAIRSWSTANDDENIFQFDEDELNRRITPIEELEAIHSGEEDSNNEQEEAELDQSDEQGAQRTLTPYPTINTHINTIISIERQINNIDLTEPRYPIAISRSAPF